MALVAFFKTTFNSPFFRPFSKRQAKGACPYRLTTCQDKGKIGAFLSNQVAPLTLNFER